MVRDYTPPPPSLLNLPQVVKAHRSVEKHAMRQIQAVAAKPVLIALTEEGIHLHALPTMLLKFQVRDIILCIISP